ncbi:recombination protein [Pseudoalteromonas phage KB12-38]|nr:recombination protein [Pseudoalteromonas phage KB12-38]
MKHISIYQTELPEMAHFQNLLLDSQRVSEEGEEKMLLLCPPCGEHSMSSFGFDPEHPILKTESGFCLQFKFETKKVTKTLVDQQVAKKIERLKLDNPEFNRLSKKQKSEITEEVKAGLVKRAIAEESFVKAYYHAESGLLILNVSTEDKAGTILAFLRRMLGSLKTTTLHVDGVSNGLTKNIQYNIENDKGLGFKGFSFGNILNLQNSDESKAHFNGDYELETLLDLINQGYEVVKVELERDGLGFTLNSDLKITGLKLASTLTEELEEQVLDTFGEGEVDLELIKKETQFVEEQTQVELLVGISNDLVAFFSELIPAENAA